MVALAVVVFVRCGAGQRRLPHLPTRVRRRVAGSSARADVERFRAFADLGGVFNDLFRRVLRRVHLLSAHLLGGLAQNGEARGGYDGSVAVIIVGCKFWILPDRCSYRAWGRTAQSDRTAAVTGQPYPSPTETQHNASSYQDGQIRRS